MRDGRVSDPIGDPVDDDEPDELPERIIVVREPIDADPDAAAAELEALAAAAAAAVAEPDEDVADEPLVEIDATLGARTPDYGRERAETGGEPVATDDVSPEAAIDLDEVDLRFEEPAAPEPAAVEVDLTAIADEVEIEEMAPDVEVEADDEDDDELLLAELTHDLAEEDDDPLGDAGPPTAPFRWEPEEEPPTMAAPPDATRPRRDETGPGTLRPEVPEPVIVARSTSPSRSRRAVRRVRALLGLVFVVVLSGVGLAAAIGAAILLVVLALSRAFGSGG